jgi:hypothetical protein
MIAFFFNFFKISCRNKKSFHALNFLFDKKHYWIITFTIILLALINNNWIFTPKGYLDPWLYFGYGLTFDDNHFGGHLKNGYYKLSRIPWVYTQYIVRKFLGHISASYFISIVFLLIGVFSVFFSIKRLLGKTVAFISSIFLCVYYPFLGSGGADYHNTFVGTLYALSFYILTIAGQSRTNLYKLLILFGFFYGLTIHTMILYLNFIPILLIHFFFLRKQNHEKINFSSFLKWLSYAFLGVSCATVACGLISLIYGYKFWFFLPQLKITQTFLNKEWSVSPWWRPFSWQWTIDAYWIAMLLSVFLLSLTVVVFFALKKRPKNISFFSLSFHVQFVCACFIWLFWHFLKKDTLSTYYFSYPLIIPMAFAIASFFNDRFNLILNVKSFAYYFASFSIFLYFCKASFFPQNILIGQFLIILLSFLLFVFSVFFIRQTIFLAAVFSFVSVTPFICNYHTNNATSSDSYLAIAKASKWLYETYGKKGIKNRAKNIFFWFEEKSCTSDVNNELTQLSYSLVNTSFDYLNFPFPMPEIDNLRLNEVNEKLSQMRTKVIVLVTRDKANVEALQTRLRSIDYHLTSIEFHEIRVNDISIPMYILKN